ncbi:MAG: YkvA family protein [Cyanobacteriota bacterium]|nr:YkvA family protein [Cyanobacteriota bacterium]
MDQIVNAEVLESSVVDEALLLRLLRRAGRVVARPALECLELLIDEHTPGPIKLTVMAALTYLLVPVDLVPDLIPAAGFSDDLVALTTLLTLCGRHRTEAIRLRAQRRLDRWLPQGR